MYLAWFDADRKKSVATKIAEAHERYVTKFGRQPLVCLVNPEYATAEAAIEVRPLQSIGRNCFWIGTDEEQDREEEARTEAAALAAKNKQSRRPRKRAAASVAPATSAQVLETIAQPQETSAPARPRRGRKAPDQEAATVAPTAPTPVPTKRRVRRDRPAA